MTSTEPVGNANPGAAFMRRLRHDHAGLSRVLRTIDGLLDRLAAQPEGVQPILTEAFGYLLRYQHGYHHPREDRLFEKIRRKRPALADTLAKLEQEHETGERETAELAEALAAAPPDTLRGKKGERLTARIHGYIQHARMHMRDEEAVFYARAEKVLGKSDWAEIIDGDGTEDPAADMAVLADQYPELAAHFDLPTHHLGRSETVDRAINAPHQLMLAVTDLYGGLLHEGFDLTRRNARRLLAIRGPIGLVHTVGAITSDNLRFAGRCVTRPSRWAINTGADWLIARVKPGQDG